VFVAFTALFVASVFYAELEPWFRGVATVMMVLGVAVRLWRHWRGTESASDEPIYKTLGIAIGLLILLNTDQRWLEFLAFALMLGPLWWEWHRSRQREATQGSWLF
jgi:hypothetical protein